MLNMHCISFKKTSKLNMAIQYQNLTKTGRFTVFGRRNNGAAKGLSDFTILGNLYIYIYTLLYIQGVIIKLDLHQNPNCKAAALRILTM